MYQLLILLTLLAAPLEAEVDAFGADRVAATLPADPCEAARAIAARGACVEPEDCGAFEGWMRLFGEPRTEPLDPRLSQRPVRPRFFPCPAQPGRPGARRGGS